MDIREAREEDLRGLLELYTQLHENPLPDIDEDIEKLWRRILDDRNQHILLGLENRKIVSSCVIVIVPNLTHGQRPYAFIENVITDENNRHQGNATAILECARKIAEKEHCYKIMLMTGSKQESTLHFYEQAGYNRKDKTAFIQWLA
ncbi:GNAT family N-acetyltransferase [Caproiciproducens galactitolivorans]|uniref:GNAT family N-acetyltransferase n=1 Tax=Caproiciproducens galactitolivorans TaxID=642589 RepID=A0ABT4BUK3_9FIRM|nr:GNAT family N-acetyltransferase [Caproiciproducens galactitolivorans]MCY1714576.1 GNAT family N-acetyltransferase [Caproiciproducens galactitolivorans]